MAVAARLAEVPWLQYYDRDVPHTVPPSKQLLYEMLSNAARDLPDRPAVIFFGQKIRYSELNLLSNRFAHALRGLGVQAGERVAILLPNVPQCVIAFYGTLKAGAIVVLGSPLSNEDEIAYQIRDSGAQVLLTLSSYQTMVERLCADTNIKQVILTDVREYLPVRQRVMIASLVEGGESQSAGATHAGEYVEEIAGGEKSRNNSTPGFAAEVMPLGAQKKTYRVYSFQQLPVAP